MDLPSSCVGIRVGQELVFVLTGSAEHKHTCEDEVEKERVAADRDCPLGPAPDKTVEMLAKRFYPERFESQ